MKSIWYDSIEDILISIEDPTTWGAVSSVPWVSSPKINAGTSVYNVNVDESLGIAGRNTDVSWTPAVWSISWSSGSINLPDGTQISISSGSATVSRATYIYVDTTDGSVYATTTATSAVWENKIMICTAFPNSWKYVSYQAFGCWDQSTLATWSSIASWTITASNIASNTITANQIASWTITANEIASNTITASEIASGAITTTKLAANAVTAAKMSVSELSAISANLWTVTAGDISWTTLLVWSTSSQWIYIYPRSSTQWSIDIYYNGSVIWYIRGAYVSSLSAWCMYIWWDYVYAPWELMAYKLRASNRLRIPVGSNMYG